MQEIFTWYIFKPPSGIRMELYCDRQTFYAVEVMESDQFSYKTIDQIVLIVWHGHTFIQYRDGVHPRYIYRTISLKRKTDIIVIYGLPLLTGNLLDYNRLQCRLRIYIRCISIVPKTRCMNHGVSKRRESKTYVLIKISTV